MGSRTQNSATLAVLTAAVVWVTCEGRGHAQAGVDGERSAWQLALQLGMGHQASSLATGRGPEVVRNSVFPAAGVELGAHLPLTAAWSFRGGFAYASSVGYELERRILSDARESSPARKQELRAHALAELEPAGGPFGVCAGLGYFLRAFTTETQLLSPASYTLSGPYALAGVRLLLFANRLELSLLGELGAVVTASSALENAGVGPSYAANAAVGVALSSHWQLAVSYRFARASLPLRSGGDFHDDQGFLFASLAWRNGS